MSTHIEWADTGKPATYSEEPGEFRDGFGNINNGPALVLGEGIVLEAESRDDMRRWLTEALSAVNRVGTVTCANCGHAIEFNCGVWAHGPEMGRHTVCDWREGMEPTTRVATPLTAETKEN